MLDLLREEVRDVDDVRNVKLLLFGPAAVEHEEDHHEAAVYEAELDLDVTVDTGIDEITVDEVDGELRETRVELCGFLLHELWEGIEEVRKTLPMTKEVEYILNFVETSQRGIIR